MKPTLIQKVGAIVGEEALETQNQHRHLRPPSSFISVEEVRNRATAVQVLKKHRVAGIYMLVEVPKVLQVTLPKFHLRNMMAIQKHLATLLLHDILQPAGQLQNWPAHIVQLLACTGMPDADTRRLNSYLKREPRAVQHPVKVAAYVFLPSSSTFGQHVQHRIIGPFRDVRLTFPKSQSPIH